MATEENPNPKNVPPSGTPAKPEKSVRPGLKAWHHWSIAILGVWHLVIITLLFWLLFDLWPIAMGEAKDLCNGTMASVCTPAGSTGALAAGASTGSRFALTDLGTDSTTQIAAAGEIVKVLAAAPTTDAVLNFLKQRATEEGILPAPTPSVTLATKLVLFLNDRLDDTELATKAGMTADNKPIPALTNVASREDVAAHNRQLLCAAFPNAPFAVAMTKAEKGGTTAVRKLSHLQSNTTPEQALLLVVMAFGAIGACVHAAIYFVGYVGRGNFVSKWFLYYLIQPFMGGVLALIFYCIVRGGLIQNTTAPSASVGTTGINVFFISGISAMVGFFSKLAIQRMEELFRTTVAASPGAARTSTSEPGITSIEPPSYSRSKPVPAVIVHGTNFNVSTTVSFDSIKSLTVVHESDTQVTAALPKGFTPASNATVIRVAVTIPVTDSAGNIQNKTVTAEWPIID